VNKLLVRRGIPIMGLTLAVCLSAIGLTLALGRSLRLGAPVLIYGYVDGDVNAYDFRRQEARVALPGAIQPDSSFFWSPDRSAALRVTLEQAAPPEETAFVLTLYPHWGTEAVPLPGRFDGYSTPAWSPDGRSVIVPACRRVDDDPGCDPFVFYRIAWDGGIFEALEHAVLADFPRSWSWLNDHTLRIWRAETLLDLDLTTGATALLFDGLPPQPRAVRWADDLSRLAYYTSTEEPFCLHVLVVAEGETQTVSCDDIDVNAPFGLAADGQTIYYARGADREIRLYDSTTRTDRPAADPPVVLDWSLDTLYPVPGTSLLIHHATFDGTTTTLIDTASGEAKPWVLNLANLRAEAQFSPAPTGWPVAILRDDPGSLGLLWPGATTRNWLNTHACCALAWME
jgi:hypothetical protein